MSRKSNKPVDLRDNTRGVRLQRAMADAGVASRRGCEELIEGGHVTVNGQLVTELPAWVDPEEDRIVVAGKVVPMPERKVYVMLNKPPRTLSTAKDEPGADRRTVVDLVDHPAASRLFPVGRLDYDTIGLILLTNDGELANRLTHPRYGVPKTYRVVVKGTLDEEAAKEIERGIFLAQRKAGQTVGGSRTAHVEIEILAKERTKTVVELTLREGRNRQVRRMLAAVGYPVQKLERVAMGPVKLKGLARGEWRELTRHEIQDLKRSAASSGDPSGKEGRSGGGKKPKMPYVAPGVAEMPPKPGVRNRTIKNAINKARLPVTPRLEGRPTKRDE
ncbi:MAG: rRNA pseudouridine synthase [Phycisphaerales bacterium]|nr:rRNA pseudouridine synthase [Phycisphaerales bacterium]